MIDVNSILKKYKKTEKKYKTIIDHTKMEDMIYNQKRKIIDETYKDIDYTISSINEKGKEKLKTFEYIPQDIFNMFYKLSPQIRKEDEIDSSAIINKKIIENIKDMDEYKALKLITEGKDYEAIEATREFIKNIYENIDSLIEKTSKEKEVINQIEKLENAKSKKEEEIENLINIYKKDGNEEIEKYINQAVQQVEGINKRINQYKMLIQSESNKNKQEIKNIITTAMEKTQKEITENMDLIKSFSTLNGEPKTIEGKTELIQKLKKNTKFREIAKKLGRIRKVFEKEEKSSYKTSRGQKIGITHGSNITKLIPSEYINLAVPELEVMFYKKYAKKQLKQYKEQNTQSEERGNIIVIGDESGSTKGENMYYTKAVAIALLDIAIKESRNYCYIPFSNEVGNVIHVNKENYGADVITKIADSFIDGGTDYNKVLTYLEEVINDKKYKKSDVVFITDGESEISNEVEEKIKAIKKKEKIKIIGIMLDKGTNIKIKEICKIADKIYKTSELTENNICEKLYADIK